MPSFDIVSQVNSMEIENAVNIANKELVNRFDFKGSKAEIVLDKNEIKLSADNAFKVKTLAEIMMGKLATQIQGEEVRVTGKNRDDLQEVIAAVRTHDFPVALQFQNFRD